MPLSSERPANHGVRFDFFFYGTLCDADVRLVVVGRDIEAEPATLDDYEAVPVHRGRFPILLFQRGRQADGVLCRGLGLVEAARVAFYEREGRDYGVRKLPIRLGEARTQPAWIYVPTSALRRGMGRWDLAEWQRYAKRDFLVRCARAMRAVDAKDLERYVEIWTGRAKG